MIAFGCARMGVKMVALLGVEPRRGVNPGRF
jgi:hypothetical protein